MPSPLPPGVRIHHVPSSQNDNKNHRSLLATRAFPAGTPIATFSSPILALPDGATMRTTCNWCLHMSSSPSSSQSQPNSQDPVKLRACTACRAAVYCSPACQRAHWKAVHKAECKMFARVREGAGKDWLPTPVRAVAQVLLLMKGGDKGVLEAFGEEQSQGQGGEDEWEGLEGNVEGFQKMEEVWKDFELQATAAVVYAGLLEGEEVLERARRVLCRIQTNAFNRHDADTGMAGLFLDAGLAMVNHSCVPNAFIGFEGRTATLRAERDIKEGEEITISYIGEFGDQPRIGSVLLIFLRQHSAQSGPS